MTTFNRSILWGYAVHQAIQPFLPLHKHLLIRRVVGVTVERRMKVWGMTWQGHESRFIHPAFSCSLSHNHFSFLLLPAMWHMAKVLGTAFIVQWFAALSQLVALSLLQLILGTCLLERLINSKENKYIVINGTEEIDVRTKIKKAESE